MKRRMAATRRLQKELGDLRKAAGKSFRDIQVRSPSDTNPSEISRSKILQGKSFRDTHVKKKSV